MALFDSGLILSVCAIIFTSADVYALYRYLPGWISRYLDRKFTEGLEQVEGIVYGLFTPTDEDILEGGKVVQPKGTVPIVAALTPLVAAIPAAIGVSLAEAFKGALTTAKMSFLGARGNEAKQTKAMELELLGAEDPALSAIMDADWVDPDLKKKFKSAAPLLKKYVGVSVTDIADILVKGAQEKIPAVKEMIEKLKASVVVANAEKIVE